MENKILNSSENIKILQHKKQNQLNKYKVISYDGNIVVFDYNGQLVQSNEIQYDGESGFIKWEH